MCVCVSTVPPKKADTATVAAALKELIAARTPKVAGDEVFAPTLAYVAALCAALQVGGGSGGAGAGAGGMWCLCARSWCWWVDSVFLVQLVVAGKASAATAAPLITV